MIVTESPNTPIRHSARMVACPYCGVDRPEGGRCPGCGSPAAEAKAHANAHVDPIPLEVPTAPTFLGIPLKVALAGAITTLAAGAWITLGHSTSSMQQAFDILATRECKAAELAHAQAEEAKRIFEMQVQAQAQADQWNRSLREECTRLEFQAKAQVRDAQRSDQ